MIKKTILFVAVFAFLGTVYAIFEGQIITQEQLDNTNLSAVDLECALNEHGIIEYRGIDWYYANVSCFSIKPLINSDSSVFPPEITLTGEYEVIVEEHYPHVRMSDYWNCRDDTGNKTLCDELLVGELRRQHAQEKQHIRDFASNYQTTANETIDFSL